MHVLSGSPFHIIVVGVGIGGLCLAQGLRKAGVGVAVYERDRSRTDRLARQGGTPFPTVSAAPKEGVAVERNPGE